MENPILNGVLLLVVAAISVPLCEGDVTAALFVAPVALGSIYEGYKSKNRAKSRKALRKPISAPKVSARKAAVL